MLLIVYLFLSIQINLMKNNVPYLIISICFEMRDQETAALSCESISCTTIIDYVNFFGV